MPPPAPFLTLERLAERIAWMHEPVHLSGARLPWFLRWYLEHALHRFFCTLERGLLTLRELQLQGKLELLPADAPAPRASRYRLKSTKALLLPAASAHLSEDAAQPAPECIPAAASPPANITPPHHPPRPALPRRGACHGLRHRPQPSLWNCGMTPPQRYDQSTFFRPAKPLRENCAQFVTITQHFLTLTC